MEPAEYWRKLKTITEEVVEQKLVPLQSEVGGKPAADKAPQSEGGLRARPGKV